MNDPLEAVQRRLLGDMRGFYSETTIDHAMRPRHVGSLPDADGYASLQSGCGEVMQVWLRLLDGHIEDATFWTDGCAATIAAGSMATDLVQQRTVAQALSLNAQEVAAALDNLPPGNFHCAQLAADTVRSATRDALEIQRDPWKKAYRKK